MKKNIFLTSIILLFFLSTYLYALKCGGVIQKKMEINGVSHFTLSDKKEVIFDSSVDPNYYSYFINLLNMITPYVDHFYGENPDTSPITIKYDPSLPDWFFYNRENNVIIISKYPIENYRVDNDGDGEIDEDPYNGMDDDNDGKIDEDYNNDPYYDQLFTHEFIHSYHRDTPISTIWIEEGMTECCTELISKYLFDKEIRDMRGRDPQKNIFLFDILEENRFLSPNINFTNSSFPEYYYNYSAAVFMLLSSKHSDSSDIYDYTLLKEINENLRCIDCTNLSSEEFYPILDTIMGEKGIDSFKYPSHFMKSLSINRKNDEETSLVLIPQWTKFNNNWYFSTVNPMNLTYFAFKRSKDENGIEREELLSSENPLTIEVYRGSIRVFKKEYTLYEKINNDWFFDTTTLSDGVYTIVGKITLENGTSLSKKVNFLVSHSGENIPTLIKDIEDGVGLILLNRDKYLLCEKPTLEDEKKGEIISSFESGGTFKTEYGIKNLQFAFEGIKINMTIPYPFSRILIKRVSLYQIPLKRLTENSFTGITIVNRNNFPISGKLFLYNEDGTITECDDDRDRDPSFSNPQVFEIPEKGEKIFIAGNLFPINLSEDNYLLFISPFPVELFYMKGDYEGSYLDGTIPPQENLNQITIPLFLLSENYITYLSLFNPHGEDVLFTIFLFDSDGTLLQFSPTNTLNGRNERTLNLNEIFPEMNSGDYIKINSSNSLISEIYIFDGSNLAVLNSRNPNFSSSLIIPHVAMGGGYYTKLHFISLESTQVTNIYISIFDSNGNLILDSFLLPQLSPYSTYSLNVKDILPSGESKDFFDGWIKITCNGNILSYSEIGDLNGAFLTIQPAFKELSKRLLFNHIAKGDIGNISYFTGLALVNPYPYNNKIEISIYDGENIDPIYHLETEISPFSRFISLVGSELLFPNPNTMGKGYIDIKSDYPIAAYEIFGDNSLNFISAVIPYY